jgi:predicted metallo-beta-lactamase superfamily hydrolase
MSMKAIIDDGNVPLNPFIEEYVAAVFYAAASTLRGVDNPETLEYIIKKDDIAITSDGTPVEFVGFAQVMVLDTLKATLKHLKGVDTDRETRVVVTRS